MLRGDFSRMLKRHRELAGLTQAELAALSGVSAAAIRDLEQARSRRPRLRSIGALAQALRLTHEQATAFHHTAISTFDLDAGAGAGAGVVDQPGPAAEPVITVLGAL